MEINTYQKLKGGDATMKNKSYNGWTNYPTWLVALWIDNCEATMLNVQNLVKKKFEYNFQCDEALKEMMEEFCSLDEASLKQDLINATLSEVNWTEIVQSYKGE